MRKFKGGPRLNHANIALCERPDSGKSSSGFTPFFLCVCCLRWRLGFFFLYIYSLNFPCRWVNLLAVSVCVTIISFLILLFFHQFLRSQIHKKEKKTIFLIIFLTSIFLSRAHNDKNESNKSYKEIYNAHGNFISHI